MDQMARKVEDLEGQEDQEGQEGQEDQVVEDPSDRMADREETASNPGDKSMGDQSQEVVEWQQQPQERNGIADVAYQP